MKVILGLVGAVGLLITGGCSTEHQHHHRARGGYYGDYYGEYPDRHYGHGGYNPYRHYGPYDRDHYLFRDRYYHDYYR